MDSIASGWMWAAFAAAVGVMLAIDLAGAGRAHRVSLREAAGWSVAWVAAAAIFGCGLFLYLDGSAGREVARDTTLAFATGYLIEKSLAIDNVFVWLMLFTFFAVPGELQRRVLVYGVLGAIAMRTGMIFGGAWLVESFDWILYVFGAILIFTGVKMWWFAGQAPDLAGNPIVRWLRSTLRMTEGYEGERFFVVRREGGRSLVYATPLFLVLVLVEAADVVFAVDSVPAIFAITTDPFIVLTSNVFAILGLRAMFFLLADMASRFAFLKYGLALVLVLVGAKMLLIEVVKIPVAVSLAAVTAIVGGSIVWSLVRARRAPGPPAVNGSAAPGQARPAR